MQILSMQHGPSQGLFSAIDLIIKAKKSVFICSYYIEGHGTAGKCLLDALKICKAPEIRILVNHSLFEMSKTQSYLSIFVCQHPKIKIKSWNHLFMNSNHAKFIVVDDKYVSFGGYNFQEALFMEPHPWNDLGMIVESSDFALELKHYFKILWRQSTRIVCKENTKRNHKLCPLLPKGRKLEFTPKIATHYKILVKYPQRWWFHTNDSESLYSILQCLSLAEKSISILCPNVIDSCVWSILDEKLMKGVKINLLTNLNQNNMQTFFSIGKREVDLFQEHQHPLLTIRFSNPGFGKNKLDTDHYTWKHSIDHSKFFDVDEQHMYVGSFNLDPISLHACGEIECDVNELLTLEQTNYIVPLQLFHKVSGNAPPIIWKWFPEDIQELIRRFARITLYRLHWQSKNQVNVWEDIWQDIWEDIWEDIYMSKVIHFHMLYYYSLCATYTHSILCIHHSLCGYYFYFENVINSIPPLLNLIEDDLIPTEVKSSIVIQHCTFELELKLVTRDWYYIGTIMDSDSAMKETFHANALQILDFLHGQGAIINFIDSLYRYVKPALTFVQQIHNDLE